MSNDWNGECLRMAFDAGMRRWYLHRLALVRGSVDEVVE